MKKLDWDSFTKRIHIHSSLNRLYECWSTEEGLCSWFLSGAEFVRKGERIANKQLIQAEMTTPGFGIIGMEKNVEKLSKQKKMNL